MNKDEKQLTRWTIDPAHSEISFKIKHLMISYATGSFRVFDATIFTREKDFTTAEIGLWIEADSIDTRDAKRDEHLRSEEFLSVRRHKQITFTSSTMAKPDADGNLELWGELTMVGITRNIKLDVHYGGTVNDPWGNEKAGFTVTAKVNRKDWELTWNAPMESGGFLVGEEILISCEFVLTNAERKELSLDFQPAVRQISVL